MKMDPIHHWRNQLNWTPPLIITSPCWTKSSAFCRFSAAIFLAFSTISLNFTWEKDGAGELGMLLSKEWMGMGEWDDY